MSLIVHQGLTIALIGLLLLVLGLIRKRKEQSYWKHLILAGSLVILIGIGIPLVIFAYWAIGFSAAY